MIRKKFSNTKSKYRNEKTTVDGIEFDSKAEAECYHMLRLMERAGQTKIIELQPKVYLTDARILYIADFLIEENGQRIYIDVKGHRTKDFNLKFRLWRHYGVGTLRLVKKGKFGFDKVDEVTRV